MKGFVDAAPAEVRNELRQIAPHFRDVGLDEGRRGTRARAQDF
jgi:hypothetical protein